MSAIELPCLWHVEENVLNLLFLVADIFIWLSFSISSFPLFFLISVASEMRAHYYLDGFKINGLAYFYLCNFLYLFHFFFFRKRLGRSSMGYPDILSDGNVNRHHPHPTLSILSLNCHEQRADQVQHYFFFFKLDDHSQLILSVDNAGAYIRRYTQSLFTDSISQLRLFKKITPDPICAFVAIL